MRQICARYEISSRRNKLEWPRISKDDWNEMTRFVAKSIQILTVLCAFSLAASGGTFPIEQDFHDQNCAITFPGGWHVMANFPSRPNLIAAYCDSSGKRIVDLVIYNKTPSGPLDDRFIAGFDRQLEKDGDTRLSGKYIEVAGIRSYQRLGKFVARGKQISAIDLLVPGEDRYYIVQGIVSDGDASEDPEILQAIGSFRFLHPFVPAYAPNLNSPEAKFAQTTVKLIMIVAVVVFLVYRIGASLKRRPPGSPPRPPPLPPGAK